MLDYDVSDLEEIWREGDKEMPDRLKKIVNAAKEAEDELLLSSLTLTADDADAIKYNASKDNKTVNEYISSVLTTSLHPA